MAKIERLVAVRLRLPGPLWLAVKAQASAARPAASVPEYVRRVLCEAVPVAERSALVANLAAGGRVGRGLSRASVATRRTVAASATAGRAARQLAVETVCRRFKLSPAQAVPLLCDGDNGPGSAFVRECGQALADGRRPVMSRKLAALIGTAASFLVFQKGPKHAAE